MGDSASGNEGFQVLLRRVRAGDGQAAAELVRRYEPAIRRAARVRLVDTRLNRLLDSMDICQSVLASFFVRTALGQYELETPEQLLKLLATMTRNKLANQVKGHRHPAGFSPDRGRRRRRHVGRGWDRGFGRARPHSQQRGRRARTPGRSPAAILARGVIALARGAAAYLEGRWRRVTCCWERPTERACYLSQLILPSPSGPARRNWAACPASAGRCGRSCRRPRRWPTRSWW